MFQLAVLEHLGDAPDAEAQKILIMDDQSCMHALQNSENPVARALAARLYERRLYKRALSVGSDQVNVAGFEDGAPIEKCRAFASRIAELAGILPHEVLVDIPSIPSEMSLGVRVKNRNAIVDFEEFSPRVRTLNATRRDQWRLGVYTLPGQQERVVDAACEVLHIRKPTRQDTLF